MWVFGAQDERCAMELIRPDKRAELMKMSKEEIIDYMEVCNKNCRTGSAWRARTSSVRYSKM